MWHSNKYPMSYKAAEKGGGVKHVKTRLCADKG